MSTFLGEMIEIGGCKGFSRGSTEFDGVEIAQWIQKNQEECGVTSIPQSVDHKDWCNKFVTTTDTCLYIAGGRWERKKDTTAWYAADYVTFLTKIS